MGAGLLCLVMVKLTLFLPLRAMASLGIQPLLGVRLLGLRAVLELRYTWRRMPQQYRFKRTPSSRTRQPTRAGRFTYRRRPLAFRQTPSRRTRQLATVGRFTYRRRLL